MLATGGWTIADVMANDDDVVAPVQFAPDAVIANIGTNDTLDCGLSPTCGPSWVATELDELWAPATFSHTSRRRARSVATAGSSSARRVQTPGKSPIARGKNEIGANKTMVRVSHG